MFVLLRLKTFTMLQYFKMSPQEGARRNPEKKELQYSGKVAVLWNGQTSFAGMGEGLYGNSQGGKEVYDATAKLLRVPLASLHLRDPERTDTQAVQFANAPYNMSSWIELKRIHPNLQIGVVGGHSFGEAFSTIAAQAATYEGFLKFLATRTELMRSVNEITPGGLMALTTRKSKTPKEVKDKQAAFAQISKELQEKFGVEVATYSSNGRQTIGGRLEAVHAAIEHAKRLREYVVAQLITENGAPHTSLYNPIVDDLKEAVRKAGIIDPIIPVVTCSKENPEFLTSAQAIEDEVVAQATQPVRGDKQQAFLLKQGFDILQIGENPIIAQNIVDDFGDDVEMEKVESHTGRNIALGVGGAAIAAGALTIGWKVTHRNKN